ncbi:MAG: MFS transporter [Chloroflexi bacterium]|nr:MFS transporter [Chloroflexota bacterium]
MAIATRLAKGRFYYGWYIVGALFISSFSMASLNNSAPAFFLKPMTEELGWSRGFFSTAVWINTPISSLIAMVLWPIIDRHGARGVMMGGGLALGLGTMALSLVQAEWHFAVIKSIVMPLGSVGLGGVMATLVVPNWFVKKRGRVLAFTVMGQSLGAIVAPPLLTYLLSILYWRHAWIVTGLAIIVLNVIPAALFMRRRPEDLGLLPDGDSPRPQDDTVKTILNPEVTWSRREILRAPTFWLVAFASPLGLLGMMVIGQHLIPYLTDPEINFSREKAAVIMMTISIVALTVKMPWGFIMERSPIRYSLAICFFSVGAGMALIALAGTNLAVIILAAVFLGIGRGGDIPLQGFLWAGYFGRSSQGKARSMAMPAQAFIYGPLGPILTGFVWDFTKTYRPIFPFYAIPSAIGVTLILLARHPQKPAQPVLIR